MTKTKQFRTFRFKVSACYPPLICSLKLEKPKLTPKNPIKTENPSNQDKFGGGTTRLPCLDIHDLRETSLKHTLDIRRNSSLHLFTMMYIQQKVNYL